MRWFQPFQLFHCNQICRFSFNQILLVWLQWLKRIKAKHQTCHLETYQRCRIHLFPKLSGGTTAARMEGNKYWHLHFQFQLQTSTQSWV